MTRMKTLFRGILPEQNARAKLDEISEKYGRNFLKFAEEFPVPATDSKFDNISLIHRIDQAIDSNTRNTMTSIKIGNPGRVPSDWSAYLQFALEVFKNTRNKAPASTTVNAVSAPGNNKRLEKKDLTSEQLEWIKKGDCACCGKHPYKFRSKCTDPKPKYRGPFNMPQRPRRDVKTINEDDEQQHAGPSTDAAVISSNTANAELWAQFEAWRNSQATGTKTEDAKDFASVV